MKAHILDTLTKLSKLGKTVRFIIAVLATLVLLSLALAIFLGCLVFDIVANLHSLGL